jgi:hypothetical protein
MAMHYSDEMIAVLKTQSTYNLDDCKKFAEQFPTVTARSVMAKVKALGLTYVTKKAAVPKVTGGQFGQEISFD